MESPMYDTSDEAQAARQEAMAERMADAAAETVSELSPLFGRAIVVDGVAGIVAYVHDTEDRASADLLDTRRVWFRTSLVQDDGAMLTATTEGF